MKSMKICLDELQNQINDYFSNRLFFGCFYGSCVLRTFNSESDIDVFIAINEYSIQDLEVIKTLVIGIHNKFNLQLDEEVTFNTKLMIRYHELEQAVNLNGFDLIEDKLVIPSIKDDPQFLNSMKMKMRFKLNALTTPHLTFGNHISKYLRFRTNGEKNMTLLGVKLLGKQEFTIYEVIESLLVSKDGKDGEMFLGYKRKKEVLDYLHKWISKQLIKMVSDGKLETRNGIFKYRQKY